jgi:multidrug transporter EmrE-like cation transporter
MWLAWLLGLIGFEVAADILVKEHSIHRTTWTFVAGLCGYVLANVCWLISMRYRSHLGLGANIFSVSTGIVAALIGCYLYQETLTPLHMLGIALGIISLALLVT